MKHFCTILLIITGTSAFAQHMVVSSGSTTLSGGVKLVLQDVSLTNNATIDGSGGAVVISTTDSVSLSSTSELILDSMATGGAAGSVTVDGLFSLAHLTISATDSLTLSDVSGVTVTGTLNNTGNLIMESGASLIINPAVAAVQGITVNRTTTFNSSTGKYSVIGSPVASASFSTLGTNAQGWIFGYDETEPYGVNGAARFKIPAESAMTSGKGYFSAFTGDETGEVVFSGVPQYKNLSYPVTRTTDASTDTEGFNLVANPFTSPISFSGFVSENTSLLSEETIWIWDDIASDAGGGSNADYMTINSIGNTDSRGEGLTGWDSTINVAQGFFVKVASSGNIVFKHLMKTHEGNDDASYYRKTSQEIERYWIGIADENGTFGSNTLIGFKSDATYSFDKKYDASKFGATFSVYSILEDQKLAIQTLPLSWIAGADDQPIALGFYAPEEGGFALSLQRSSDPSGVSIYLNDHLNGTSVNLMQEEYSFRSQAGSHNDRFSLSLTPLTAGSILALKNHHLDLVVFGVSGAVKVRSEQAGELALWSIDGKQIIEQPLSIGEMELKVPSRGLYVLTVQTREGKATYKVMVRD